MVNQSVTMPLCIQHNFIEVSNHYNKEGVIDIESFSDGEWRTEKVCSICGEVWQGNKFLEAKLKV